MKQVLKSDNIVCYTEVDRFASFLFEDIYVHKDSLNIVLKQYCGERIACGEKIFLSDTVLCVNEMNEAMISKASKTNRLSFFEKEFLLKSYFDRYVGIMIDNIIDILSNSGITFEEDMDKDTLVRMILDEDYWENKRRQIILFEELM